MSVLEATKRKVVPVSVFELFSIGLGPSSSHTVGPMRAAKSFIHSLQKKRLLPLIREVIVELYGSLAMTGKGHGTDTAILLGLEGESPESVDPASVASRIASITENGQLRLGEDLSIPFDPDQHMLFRRGDRLTYHSNAMRFKAFDARGECVANDVFYSVGGGFIVHQDQIFSEGVANSDVHVPYPFQTCKELQEHCLDAGKTIAQIMMENEKIRRSEAEIKSGILRIWTVMQESAQRGCQNEGILPGGLQVKRRAPSLYRKLVQDEREEQEDPHRVLDWVSLWALAVNEENAAGGRIVTAPTNGAAGVIPAVLHYYQKFTPSPTQEGVITFLLTAAAIGILYKEGASISAAEMGCQGEVGVACSMAAGALTAALGGTFAEIESAAEIGMEHHLGLTCDPIAGLVQIPCIMRNTKGALHAINASRRARDEKGENRVRLDEVILTMRKTGEDMHSKYKETSEGGLALHVPVNLPQC